MALGLGARFPFSTAKVLEAASRVKVEHLSGLHPPEIPKRNVLVPDALPVIAPARLVLEPDAENYFEHTLGELMKIAALVPHAQEQRAHDL